MSEGFVERDGGRLYYEVTGDGREVVVLVHGFSLDARMWDDQVEALGQRYRVVRYDARGFGRSSVPEVGVPYSHADDWMAVLGKAGVGAGEQVHVVGLSMGGAMSVDFALSYPAVLRSLTLIGSGLRGFKPPAHLPPITPGIAEVAAAEGLEKAKEAWLRLPLFAPALERREVGERLRRMVEGYSGWHWVHEDDPGIQPELPAAQRLAEITVPTLVLVGDRDVPRILAVADALEAGIKGARKVVLPGVGHMTNMEAPREVNELMLEFLGGLSL